MSDTRSPAQDTSCSRPHSRTSTLTRRPRSTSGNPDRAPLLIIAGGSDHVVPAAVDHEAAGKYAKGSAVTEYREFPGRSHWTVGEPGWETVADYALDWATQKARTLTPA